ncbi:GAF and ANTAR domain-containing protein [Allobranchiibius sp. GilTou38]|uniref:GAF and ANTAR domain-containing protein n=1 Tax=Allobranchiibius sp. GilTou38 TaxID=2815210 RepID=UPI001AA13DF0|nr:GAF and ANTAR domain-containing protein [Allobranchiibius sp. GilTou38]MBO1768169.1 GAF and ANTAR domain-containing protein [Allobranchiibius sp. GilTou38]
MVTQERLVEAFVDLADTLVAEFDVIDFLHSLASTTVELLDADAAGLMLADQRGELHLLAASSDETRTLELFELQHNQGPCLDAYREGKPVTNIDPATAEERWPAFGAAVRAGNFTSVHAIPMRLRDEVIGAMNLFLARPGDLSNADLLLGQGLADIATIGLLQERAVQQQQILAEQLQGALNSRVVIEQAKGMLAARHGVSVLDAFAAMRTYARRNGRSLSHVAVEIIDGSLDEAQLRVT